MFSWIGRIVRKVCPRPSEEQQPVVATPQPANQPAGPVENIEGMLHSAIERLLEDEGLTADLIDPAARQLLEWGTAQVNRIFREAASAPAEIQAHLSDLRREIRAIARQVGQLPPEEQPDALRMLLKGKNRGKV